MDAQALFDNFTTVAEAPGGIQRLRELVLQLAVTGRLTRQNQSDEAALELVTRVRRQGEETPRRSRFDTADTETEVQPEFVTSSPFAIPDHWTWARFGDVASSRLGKMLDKAKNTGPLRPYLRNANVQWFRFDLSDIHELRLEERDLEAHVVRPGDLVICEGGEPGRVAVCDGAVDGMVIQKALHRARPKPGVDSWYLAYLLQCYAGSGFLRSYVTGATIKHLTGKALRSVPVPVPPSREQRRIVRSIELLMGACDRLETALIARSEVQSTVAAALVRIV